MNAKDAIIELYKVWSLPLVRAKLSEHQPARVRASLTLLTLGRSPHPLAGRRACRLP